MTWWNPLTWFSRITYGVFVEVHLDYGFGEIEPCHEPEGCPEFRPCLYITDLPGDKAAAALKGKRFDWHASRAEGCAPFSHWRHYLELDKQFYQAKWEDVQKYLAEAT